MVFPPTPALEVSLLSLLEQPRILAGMPALTCRVVAVRPAHRVREAQVVAARRTMVEGEEEAQVAAQMEQLLLQTVVLGAITLRALAAAQEDLPAPRVLPALPEQLVVAVAVAVVQMLVADTLVVMAARAVPVPNGTVHTVAAAAAVHRATMAVMEQRVLPERQGSTEAVAPEAAET